jgi:hypothetical protein
MVAMTEHQDIVNVVAERLHMAVLQVESRPNQVRVVGRVTARATPGLLEGFRYLHMQQRAASWSCKTLKDYVLKGDVLVYGWLLIFQFEDDDAKQALLVSLVNIPNTAAPPVDVVNAEPKKLKPKLYGNGKGVFSADTMPPLMAEAAARGSVGVR